MPGRSTRFGLAARESISSPTTPDASAGDWLRRAEQALAEGDLLQCVELLMIAADDCLSVQDPDEALWHLQRALRLLDRVPAAPHRLMLRCQLAERLQTLAQERAGSGERAGMRRLYEQARDLGFEVVAGAERLEHLGQRAGLMRRVAELFDALGDSTEAQALRERTLGTLAPPDAAGAAAR